MSIYKFYIVRISWTFGYFPWKVIHACIQEIMSHRKGQRTCVSDSMSASQPKQWIMDVPFCMGKVCLQKNWLEITWLNIMTLLKRNRTKNKLNIMPMMTWLSYGLMNVVHKRKCQAADLRYSYKTIWLFTPKYNS